MRSRNSHEKAERRESILDAAQECFTEYGFETTSMDQIAQSAGVSRGLVYAYFNNKQGIYDALRFRASDVLHGLMTSFTESEKLGIEKMRACGLAFYAFYKDERKHFDCLSHSTSQSNLGSALEADRRPPEMVEKELAVMSVMLDSIQLGIKDGSISPDEINTPLQTALFVRGSLYGLLALQSEHGSALFQNDEHGRDEFILRGIDRLTRIYAAEPAKLRPFKLLKSPAQ